MNGFFSTMSSDELTMRLIVVLIMWSPIIAFAGLLIWFNKQPIKRVLNQSDPSRVIGDLYTRFCTKNFELLSPPIQIIFLLDRLYREVQNGGADQYLFNSTSDLHEETMESLKTVGAVGTYELLREMGTWFEGGKVPRDRATRKAQLFALQKNDGEGDEDDWNDRYNELERHMTRRLRDSFDPMMKAAVNYFKAHIDELK